MRRFLSAVLPAVVLLAGCGGGAGGGSGRDLNLALEAAPAAHHAGIYLAAARGYDRAVGVTLRIGGDPPDARLVGITQLDSQRNIAVMALLPGEFYLATDRVTLDERRDDVRAAVEALQRGYEEAIVDPESAVAAMADAEGLDRAQLLSDLDRIAPGFKRGGRDFGLLDAGELEPGTFDASLAVPSDR